MTTLEAITTIAVSYGFFIFGIVLFWLITRD